MDIKVRIKSPKKFNVEELLNFLSSELNINEDVELLVAYNDKLLDKLSTDSIEFKALLYSPLPHHYVLYVRENVFNLQQILCHEMVHLQQYERGDLKMSNDFKTVTWKGEEYTNDSYYEDREWEVEAFSKQNKLWKKFKNGH